MSKRTLNALFASVLAVSFGAGSAVALEGIDGTDYFSEVPVLVDTEEGNTEFNQYVEVSIAVPEEETVGMQAVVIEQEQNPQDLALSAEDVTVVMGENFDDEAAEVPATVTFQENNGREQILVNFERSVQPGNAVTIQMEPGVTQELSGSYLFGVSAWPSGDRPRDYFLGFARATFTIEGTDG